MKKLNLKWLISIIILLIVGGATGAIVNINIENDKYNATIEYSEEEQPAVVEDDKGELVEDDSIPTVEEVDGGKFEDNETGLAEAEGEYDDLGWSEWYDTSSPIAFKNATIGRCIYALNRFGAQCVSLARVYWWSYANRDVSTCGTGMAKGMMNCWQQNAGNDFNVFWGNDNIQAGDWLVFNGGQYGHVGMALGPVVNGYVALLGENQGGSYCQGGGAATNIINISVKNLIGGYRPKKYIKPTPKPTPTPAPTPAVDKCKEWDVKKGDTMGKIMKTCEGKITWGEAMNKYADSWISKRTGKSVFYGWTHGNGYGLFYDDTIIKK